MAERCPFCRSGDSRRLPVPNERQSMLSDGRIRADPLRKLRCLGCGSLRHAAPLSADVVAAFYDRDYALPGLAAGSDDARGNAYADALVRAVDSIGRLAGPARILDLGCGSGALLRHIGHRLPDARLTGVDPALEAAGCRDGIRRVRGRMEDLDLGERFDWVISVNTIEHVHEPAAFMAGIAGRLAPGGVVSIVCPSHDPANDELLFFDHLWTFTPQALHRLGGAAGLTMTGAVRLEGPLRGFSSYRFEADADHGRAAPAPDEATGVSAETYLAAWADLDRALCDLIADEPRPQAFGVGQMAALVRAYAPRAFARLDGFWMDDPAQAWPIAEVRAYEAGVLAGQPVVCLVNARAQRAVADRLSAEKSRPILLPIPE